MNLIEIWGYFFFVTNFNFSSAEAVNFYNYQYWRFPRCFSLLFWTSVHTSLPHKYKTSLESCI